MSFPHVFLNNEPFPRHVNLNKDPPPQHLRIQCVRNTLYRWQGLRLQEPQILKAAWRARRTDNCPQGSFENGSSSEGKAEHTALQKLPTSRGDCPPPHRDQGRRGCPAGFPLQLQTQRTLPDSPTVVRAASQHSQGRHRLLLRRLPSIRAILPPSQTPMAPEHLPWVWRAVPG